MYRKALLLLLLPIVTMTCRETEPAPHPKPLAQQVEMARRTIDDCHYAYLRRRLFADGLASLDSLEQDSFVREHCQYELLSGKAGLNQLAGNNAEALRLAESYEQLPPHANKDAYIRQMEIIGGVHMYCGNDIHRAIHALERAVEAYRQGGQSPLIIRIISRLGSYYRMTGRYEKAAATNREAISSYNDSLPAQNVVIAYGEQANLYGELGIYDHALEMNRQAQYYSLRSDSFGLGDLYRYRANLYRQMAKEDGSYMDSAFHYLRLAGKVSARQGSYKGVFVNNTQLAAALLQYPDSVQSALTLLQTIAPDTVRMPQWVKYEFCQQLGDALRLSGNEARGILLIRRAAAGFAAMNMAEEEFEANRQLMEYYQNHGEKRDFMHYYNRNRLFADSLSCNESLRKVAAANIRFETDRISQENLQLTARVERQQQRQRHNTIIIVLLVFSVIVSIFYLLRRRKADGILLENKSCEIENKRKEIEQLLTQQWELNRRNEELSTQIKEATTGNKLTALHNLTVSTLLSREDEQRFRQSFAHIHPDYLLSLRKSYPQLTRNEELLAMLIALNHSTDEIALIMSINRNSVNVIRSRMRKNMGLAKEQSLDELLRGYL